MKKNKKINKCKFAILVLIIILSIYFYLKNTCEVIDNVSLNSNTAISNAIKEFDYDIVKQDINKNYLGVGQEKVQNKDGYFTTFTTIETNKKIYKEYKQNGNSSWANNEYWGGTMKENGCGITAISTIFCGYNKNYTPEDLRKKYYPVLDNDTISQELYYTFGVKNSDFYYDNINLSKNQLKKHLETNRPILICVWNKPNNNRWTTTSHYMVLLATDGNDMVYVSSPNGLENNSKSSGWYNFNEVVQYIAKALYIENY